MNRIRYAWTALWVLPRAILRGFPGFLLVWDTEIQLAMMKPERGMSWFSRFERWVNGLENRIWRTQANWHSAVDHGVLSLLLSEACFWCGRIGSYGFGLTMGFIASVWAFFAYKAREHRQKARGLEFERGDLIGPALNVLLWLVCVLAWTLGG